MQTLFGISSCDTVKKSRAWFDAHAVACQLHDFKKQGVPVDQLSGWIVALGWEALVNKKGTTWRNLTLAEQAAVTDAASAQALMLRQPSVVKRPVVVHTDASGAKQVTVGFSPQVWQGWLSS